MAIWTNMKRVARYGLAGFIRNGFISLAAVAIMLITIFVGTVLLISGAALSSVLSDLTNQVEVTVYFTPDATQDQITQLQTELQSLPEVATTTFVSSDQALAEYQSRHANDQLMMQGLQMLGTNPFGPELRVQAKDTSQYDAIAKYVQAKQTADTNSGIDNINYQQNETAINRLTAVLDTSRKLGIAIGLIFALASILITFNTIRLAIYTARDEIGVMNLVGASHWYVRGPFMIAGVLYGVISGLIVLILLYPITLWLGPGSQAFFGTFNVFTYYVSHFFLLFVVTIGIGVVLGALSSFLAVRRYLK